LFCSKTSSEQPKGHAGLTSKAEDQGFKVSGFMIYSISQWRI